MKSFSRALYLLNKAYPGHEEELEGLSESIDLMPRDRGAYMLGLVVGAIAASDGVSVLELSYYTDGCFTQ